AVTLPLASTFATSLLSDDQITFLLVAFEGLTVAVIFPVSPTINVNAFGVTLITLTGTYEGSSLGGGDGGSPPIGGGGGVTISDPSLLFVALLFSGTSFPPPAITPEAPSFFITVFGV